MSDNFYKHANNITLNYDSVPPEVEDWDDIPRGAIVRCVTQLGSLKPSIQVYIKAAVPSEGDTYFAVSLSDGCYLDHHYCADHKWVMLDARIDVDWVRCSDDA